MKKRAEEEANLKLTAKEKVIRLNKNIRKKYEVNTFYKFSQELTKLSDDKIKQYIP